MLLEDSSAGTIDLQKGDQVGPRSDQARFFLEAKIMKLRLSYFGHVMQRQDLLENKIMLEKVKE